MSARDFLPWLPAGAAPADDAPSPPRRDFVKQLGLCGLVVAIGPIGIRRLGDTGRLLREGAEPWSPHVYLAVADDGIVTILCHRSEMGQGIRTTMPMIIADEMEADWAMCRVEQADGDSKYGSQNTDGSTSIRDFLSIYREAGATLRALFEDAAAREWGVNASEVRARNHEVVHESSERTRSFGSLVATARTLELPPAARIRIKRPDERRWEGRQMTSIDLVPMTTGKAVYGADLVLPGMKIAVIARPPVWGGKAVSVDDSAARRVPGVEAVVRIPETPVPSAFFPLGGVAVVARNTWAAMKGRDALKITWEAGPNGTYDSESYKAALQAAVRQPGAPGRTNGDVTQALAGASRTLSAEYYVPHLSHA
ncbi:MAG: xanthine dehydrogenase family protein molybdopterin-binding subunit, partial [Gemmatimonadales bacterium]